MTTKTGIYQIKNTVTGKVYIGSAVDIDTRWYIHKRDLKNNKHHSYKLQNSINKYGIENFMFEIIEECDKKILIEREQYWIDATKSFEVGYNVAPTAGNCLGRKHSEETKNRMSNYWKEYHKTHDNFNKGKKQETSQETRKKLSEAFKGRTYEEIYGPEKAKEMKEKRRLSALGKKHTEETKKLLSEKAKIEWELGIHENNREKKVK
jgi:group I intron endonuclease